MKVVFFGNNSFREHKRGVENVIDFQSKACDFERIYYFHLGLTTRAYKTDDFACISIRHCWYWPIILNLVLLKIRRHNRFFIHSHHPLFSLFSIKPTSILTVHDGLYYYHKSTKHKYSFLFYILEYLTYFRCSCVHFISNYTKEQTLFGRRKNFIIIPNTSHLEPLVARFEWSDHSTVRNSVLVVRSIEERARFDLLMQVAEGLKGSEYHFTVAGKGPLLAHYQAQIENLKPGNIEMLGYIPDGKLVTLYAECSMVLVMAEYGEGFGLPIVEGYLFNKPVIASNRCAIPEIIFSAEYLFENTVDSVIQAIRMVSENKIQKFREYYDLKYSNSIVLGQIRDLYSKFNHLS